MIKDGISRLIERKDLTYKESQEIMKEIMSGEATEAQIGSFLTALRMKGETIDEITAFSEVMRQFCHQIHPKVDSRLVDTCGTGGDRIKTFNISTTAAFIVAGTDIHVAKHGNRSVTSKCGSADVLAQLGIKIDSDPEIVERNIEEVGIGFMFAPRFHPAMKYAIGPRREIAARTVFNILGPLTNPANADAQLLGVFSDNWIEPLINVLHKLELKEAMVVHGLDGLDEISTIGTTRIAWLRNGETKIIEKNPRDFGLGKAKAEEIAGTTPEESAAITFNILNGLSGQDPKKDIVMVNAAAGIIVGGRADDFEEGLELAQESIENGQAYERLRMLVKKSGGDLSKIEELESKYL